MHITAVFYISFLFFFLFFVLMFFYVVIIMQKHEINLHIYLSKNYWHRLCASKLVRCFFSVINNSRDIRMACFRCRTLYNAKVLLEMINNIIYGRFRSQSVEVKSIEDPVTKIIFRWFYTITMIIYSVFKKKIFLYSYLLHDVKISQKKCMMHCETRVFIL